MALRTKKPWSAVLASMTLARRSRSVCALAPSWAMMLARRNHRSGAVDQASSSWLVNLLETSDHDGRITA